jgi:hypothetical protein
MTTCSYVDVELSYVLHYAVDYMPVLRLYYDMNIYLMHISSHWTFSNEVPLAGVLFRVRTDYLVVWVTGGEASGSDLAVHDDDSAVERHSYHTQMATHFSRSVSRSRHFSRATIRGDRGLLLLKLQYP